MTNKANTASKDVYAIVTDKIVAALENGTVPWHKPWKTGSENTHMNFQSKKAYRGVNIWLLDITAATRGFSLPFWMTFNQIKAMGGMVNKGEKATMVVYWNLIDKNEIDSDGKKVTKKIPLLRYYNVFNVAQATFPQEVTDKFVTYYNSLTVDAKENSEIAECKRVADTYIAREKITLAHRGDKACYSPLADAITMPKMNSFESSEEYYSTLFHEMAHSTGAKKRLNREECGGHFFGSEEYSKEELVAEFGAAFLSGLTGINVKPVTDNSAAYIASWLKVLKDDKRIAVNASQRAQKAVDFIIDGKPGEEDNNKGN